jgi:hypothetical protein
MDVVAHGLGAGAAAKAASRKLEHNLEFFRVVIWGILPDAVEFLPITAVLRWFGFFGEPIGSRLLFSRRAREALPEWLRPENLYEFSHSLVVFLAVFLLVWLFLRRPALVMLTWPLHV